MLHFVTRQNSLALGGNANDQGNPVPDCEHASNHRHEMTIVV
jgi:hypothetical protein